jgi:hypothetical protein
MPARSPQMLLDLLESKIVVTLDDVQAALHGASRATAFRYLAQIPYRRSYNHNGRHYTMYEPSRYDRFGLWSRDGVRFSVDGTLRATVRRLVHEAEAGLTHRELHDRLRVRVRTTLLELLAKGEITRERLAEVFVHLHVEPAVYQAQIQRRQEWLTVHEAAAAEDSDLSDSVIIQVLLTLVRHPGAQPTDVVRYLHGLAPPISLSQVQAVFTRFELGEKGGPSLR